MFLSCLLLVFFFFFFNDTATTEIYTLSLHDALPIFPEWIPWSLRYLRYLAVLVHAASALLTIGLFMIHIYMSVFAERGAFQSAVRGDVSEEFARRYHPGWYKEVVGTAPAPRK